MLDMLFKQLENEGLDVLLLNKNKKYIVCCNKNNPVTPYVFWTFNEKGGLFWGHYFSNYGEVEDYFIKKIKVSD